MGSGSPREEEGLGVRDYDRQLVVGLACREEEWRQERKRLREEVKRLRKVVEEKEERIREIQGNNGEKVMGWSLLLLMEEERSWRDEAMDKWKKLYLEIKKELDDLIHRTTHQVGAYGREDDQEKIEQVKKELEAKEETIKALKMKLASMEYEGYKSRREVDILRQSLRILSINN